MSPRTRRRPAAALLAAASLAAFAASLAAQSSVDLPTSATTGEGLQQSSLVGSGSFRTQIVVAADAVAPTVAVLTGLRLRADRPSGVQPARSVPNFTVRIGTTTIAVGGMATNFAQNTTTPLTEVFQGSLYLPAQGPELPGPRPFDIVIPFTAPFVFDVTQGNLLIELLADNPPCIGFCPAYWLDAVHAGGTTSTLGAPGTMASGDRPFASVTAAGPSLQQGLTMGNGIEFRTDLAFGNPPGLAGFSFTPLPAPIDMAPSGAPGNLLWIDPVALVPLHWTQSFGWQATALLNVPTDPNLIGAFVYHQSAVLDPVNAFGAVFSNATETRIGDPNELLPMQQLEGYDPLATDGDLLDGWVMPIRLEGSFF